MSTARTAVVADPAPARAVEWPGPTAARALGRTAPHGSAPAPSGPSDRAGLPAVDLRSEIQAAMLNAALRTAVEHYAWRSDDEPDPATAEAELVATIRSALADAAEGLS